MGKKEDGTWQSPELLDKNSSKYYKEKSEDKLYSKKTSFNDALWLMRGYNDNDVMEMLQKHEVSEIVARLLAARSVSVGEVENFLQPTIKNYMPDPNHLLDMEKAADFLSNAIINNKKIAVFGDYDVDGATSTSVLVRFLKSVGVKPKFHIPDRMKEGYGPNKDAFKKLKDSGVDVCVTVDCGTLSFEPIAYAKEIGLDIIVIDHHLSLDVMPESIAVVNPNRIDDTSEHGYMAAVGVTFLLCVAVTSALKNKNFFENKKAPNLLELLDLVALGTVCDVVPLKGLNRAFVSQGIKILKARTNIGLGKLAEIASINEAIGTYHLGFLLGPRINAGGRVGQSDLGVRLLTGLNPDECLDYAKRLDDYNAERRTIEQQVLEEALEQAEEKAKSNSPFLMLKGKDWHHGVVGIVAGRLKEKYYLPTAVISVNDEGVGKASARSITGVDFGSAIVEANSKGLLLSGGGHAMAAGFSVHESKMDELENFLCEKFSEGVATHGTRKLKLDAAITVNSVTPNLINDIEKVGPFGMGNSEPVFLLSSVIVTRADLVGSDHLRLIIKDSNLGNSARTMKAMCFRCIGTPLGDKLLSSVGQIIDIAAKLRINNWQGVSRAEIFIEDAM